VYSLPTLQIFTELSDNDYPDCPAATYSVVLYIKCSFSNCASALAYRLWLIIDRVNLQYGKNATLLALSYLFLDDGVFAFCLFDSGLHDLFTAFTVERSQQVVTKSPVDSDLSVDQDLEHKIMCMIRYVSV
jgi:hypothetical protein